MALQSGDVLEPTDAVLVMPPSETHECGYNERIGRFANLEEHDFEPGVAKDIEVMKMEFNKSVCTHVHACNQPLHADPPTKRQTGVHGRV